MARGIERCVLFRSDDDRQQFVERLGAVVLDAGAVVSAWSLMPNHFHLLLRTGTVPLSRLLQRLLTGYAVTFNRRHRRSGHLFQNRFKSVLVDSDHYLLELIRYIHLNPVRAGLVADLEALATYRWIGHAAMLASEPPPPWHDMAVTLQHFSLHRETARAAYLRFVAEGMGQGPPELAVHTGFVRTPRGWHQQAVLRRGREAWAFAERVLGRAGFVESVRAVLPPVVSVPEPPQRRADPAAIVAAVASRFGLISEELTGGGRRPVVVQARIAAAQLLVRRCGMPLTATARLLGVSRWSVTRALQCPSR